MDRLIWEQRPTLRNPIALMAFEGWGDAGESSSMAVRHLIDEFDAERLAIIDSDDFFDFQVRRPEIELDHEGTRDVRWPDCEVWAVRPFGSERDLVIITGHEPHTRWKAFCRDVVTVLDTLGVGIAVTMGAFIGQVPHTLPVPLVGSSSRPDLLERHSLFTSGYEGPTGIVGVLHDALSRSGLPTASLWAAVPGYASQLPSPRAAFAVLDRLCTMMGTPAPVSAIAEQIADYDAQVDALIADDDDLVTYVRRLESIVDEISDDDAGAEPAIDDDDPGQLAAEVEQFLREHDGDG